MGTIALGCPAKTTVSRLISAIPFMRTSSQELFGGAWKTIQQRQLLQVGEQSRLCLLGLPSCGWRTNEVCFSSSAMFATNSVGGICRLFHLFSRMLAFCFLMFSQAVFLFSVCV